MKIALIQMDVGANWSDKELPNLLQQASGVDLIVFPECMPFWHHEEPIAHEDAVAKLEKAGREVSDRTFIAGGYVTDGRHTYNRAYFVNRGVVENFYDKQIRWTGEYFKEGKVATCFEWFGEESNLFKCIPLICADAGDDLVPRKVRMMAAALDAGSGKTAPIVISSYGGGLMTDYWQPALREWSQGCDAPVLICGIAGTDSDQQYSYQGRKLSFGGGGSGAFWPDGHELQCEQGGIVVIDLEERTLTHTDIIEKTETKRSKT
jgi:predicted amidohydrolase